MALSISIFYCVMLADWRSSVRSTVINMSLHTNSAATAFFYCSRSTAEPLRAKPVEVLSALLKQLCSSETHEPVSQPVAREYEIRKRRSEEDCSPVKRLTVDDCVRLIIELTEEHAAIMVVDALDECDESTRDQLLEAFDKIIVKSGSVVKIFVSSRDDVDIVSHPPGRNMTSS